MHLILRLVRLAGLVLLVTCLVLFFQFNVFALQFVDSLAQGTGWIAFLVLCGLEVLGLFWLYMAWRPKRSKLVLKENPTDEERAAFVAELAARLAENPHVRAAGIRPDDPEFLEKSLALLDAKADEIIRSDARRIFLGTALAQNGRLDALIVFLVLARMVWRISALYNQRPTPAEIWSVYTSVSASAFVAFSIDALDIPQTVTESLGSLVPAVAPHMAGTSMPFVSATMHLFTSCVLDGAANGLLAVRAGVLTKNAFCLANLAKSEARTISSREIRQNMLSLSKECLGDITTGLKEQLKDMAGTVADSAVEKTVTAARTVASSVSGAASSAGDFVMKGVRGGEAAVSAVASGVGSTVDMVTNAASKTTDTVSGAVSETRDFAQSTLRSATQTLSNGGQAVVRTVQSGTGKAKNFVRSAGNLFSSVLPGKHEYTQEELLALKIALLWSKGPLSTAAVLELEGEFGQYPVPHELADALNRIPNLDLLAPYLEAWKGRKKDILDIMNKIDITPCDEREKAYLEQLGLTLRVGRALAGR